MKQYNANIEALSVNIFRKSNFLEGYYDFLKCADKYFLKGNIFHFDGKTDLLKDCYSDPLYQSPQDKGIFILRKDGSTYPLNQGKFGRNPLLSDSGEFSIKIQRYKELKKSQATNLKNLLGNNFSNFFQKQLNQ